MNASPVMPVDVEEVLIPDGLDNSNSNHRESEVYRDSYLEGFNRSQINENGVP
jgi:hypothetical protein